MTMTGNPPFFIVGVQRSGTTLLRLILNSHSEIAIPEEARFLSPLLTRREIFQPLKGERLTRTIEYLKQNEQLALWNFDPSGALSELHERGEITVSEIMDRLFSAYAESEGKIRWGDKSLFFGSIELLDHMFPDACYIHVVRDGRDVFNSWKKMDPTKNRVATMALDWRYKVHKIETAFKKLLPDRTFTVRYEDLIGNPEATVKSICDFLSVDYEDGMLNFHQSSSRYIGRHHSQLIFRPIDEHNKEKWRHTLSKDQQVLFELAAGPALKRYGYTTCSVPVSPRHWLALGGDLAIGLPLRASQILSARLTYRRALRNGEPMKTIDVGEKPNE